MAEHDVDGVRKKRVGGGGTTLPYTLAPNINLTYLSIKEVKEKTILPKQTG